MLALNQLRHAELPVVKEVDRNSLALGVTLMKENLSCLYITHTNNNYCLCSFLGPGLRGMLNDSFISSFCSDEGNTTDSGVNDDSDASCSQATSIGDTGDIQDTKNHSCNPSQSSVVPVPYTSACSQEEMLALYYPFMALSLIDMIDHSSHPNISSNTEPITRYE